MATSIDPHFLWYLILDGINDVSKRYGDRRYNPKKVWSKRPWEFGYSALGGFLRELEEYLKSAEPALARINIPKSRAVCTKLVSQDMRQTANFVHGEILSQLAKDDNVKLG